MLTRTHRFAEEILDEKDPDRTCKTLTQLPSVNNAELFLLWLARTREGQICDRISVTLLKNRLDHLKRTVGLYSCQAFTKEEAKYLRKVQVTDINFIHSTKIIFSMSLKSFH
jgi:hypothetical protein